MTCRRLRPGGPRVFQRSGSGTDSIQLEVLAIARMPFRPQRREPSKQLRVNEQIRITPIRLIDENNEQLGIVPTHEAMQRARDARLDLVEVSPGSEPPVCRIMDYGKWKYQQQKKEQKARSHSKQSELKEVRLRPKIDDHDLDIKVEKSREFLSEGHKVQFTLMFRGREMAHRELGLKTLVEVKQRLADISKVEMEPRMAAGRRMTMLLVPDRSGKQNTPKPAAAPTPVPDRKSVV